MIACDSKATVEKLEKKRINKSINFILTKLCLTCLHNIRTKYVHIRKCYQGLTKKMQNIADIIYFTIHFPKYSMIKFDSREDK